MKNILGKGVQLNSHLIIWDRQQIGCICSPGWHFEEKPIELSRANEVFLWLHINGKAGKNWKSGIDIDFGNIL